MGRTYKLTMDEETSCFQSKYVFPGEGVQKRMLDVIKDYVRSKKHIYNGGWAIHKFLDSISHEKKIYNEDNICEMADVDVYGVDVVSDLVGLGKALKHAFPEMNFLVNNGVHPNQYFVSINFLGQKLVDWIHVSPKVFKFLPTVTYANGDVCVTPWVELMRHYYMLSNLFMLAGSKSFDKVLGRVSLLEKFSLIPWLKDNKMWYKKDIVKVTENAERSFGICDTFLKERWFDTQQIVCKLPISHPNECEYVVHDAYFNKAKRTFIATIRAYCKQNGLPLQNVRVIAHEPFMGVAGPLYNGWIEVVLPYDKVIRLYSLATPVHVTNNKTRECSYFFTMSHLMWRIMWLQYTKQSKPTTENSEAMYIYNIAKWYKGYSSNDKFYTLTLLKDNFIGKTPVNHIPMINNILRFKNINTLKLPIDEQKDYKNIPTFYEEYDGKIIFSGSLNNHQGIDALEMKSLYPKLTKNKETKAP